jgi:hypothetical protein
MAELRAWSELSAERFEFVWVTQGAVTHLAGAPGWTGSRRPACGQRVDETALEHESGPASRELSEATDGTVELHSGWYGPNGALCARCLRLAGEPSSRP